MRKKGKGYRDVRHSLYSHSSFLILGPVGIYVDVSACCMFVQEFEARCSCASVVVSRTRYPMLGCEYLFFVCSFGVYQVSPGLVALMKDIHRIAPHRFYPKMNSAPIYISKVTPRCRFIRTPGSPHQSFFRQTHPLHRSCIRLSTLTRALVPQLELEMAPRFLLLSLAIHTFLSVFCFLCAKKLLLDR
jgi:hypothetical protein